MPIELLATYRSFAPPVKADKRIRTRLKALEQLNPNIESCAVTAEQSHNHQLKGSFYRVAIAVTLADGNVIADHEFHHRHAHEDFGQALDDAFDALGRVLRSPDNLPPTSFV